MSSWKASECSAGVTMGPHASDLEGPLRAPFPQGGFRRSQAQPPRGRAAAPLEVKQVLPPGLLWCSWTDLPKGLLRALRPLQANLPLHG